MRLFIVGGSTVITRNFINDVGSEVSSKVVPDELVTLMSWDSRYFLIFLVMVGWKG